MMEEKIKNIICKFKILYYGKKLADFIELKNYENR